MKPRLPALLLGLALGSGATWLALSRSASADASAGPSSPNRQLQPPAWSWRDSPAPPPLPPDLVAPAILAWSRLRAPDGSPAAYPARASALRALLARLSSADFPRLLAVLPSADSEPNRRLRQIAYDGWVALDAPAAARWAAANGKAFSDLVRQATRAWSALDAPATAAWACSIPDRDLAATLARDALLALARTAPESALALANSRDDAFRAAVLPDLVEILAKGDPATAVQALAPGAWDNGSGFNQLRDSIRAWTLKDPAAALAWLAKQPRNSSDADRWVARLAETPEEMRTLAGIVAATPGFPQQAETLGELIFGWGTTPGRSAEALAWLSEHSDANLRVDALLSITGQHPSGHPELALPLVLSLPPSQRRAESLGILLTAWNKTDSGAALEWMRAQAGDPGVAAASASLQAMQLADIARAEPATAVAEWATLSDRRARIAAISPIAQAWGKTDPAAALRWQTEQNAALGLTGSMPAVGLLAAWAKQEPEPALRWTETYLANGSAEKNPWLAQQMLDALGSARNPAATRASTADLYSKIQDPSLRAETLTRHVRDWLAKDPAAARAWLESAPALTPAQRASILAAK